MKKNSFASDNISCACPEVMSAVIAANTGNANSYGHDVHSEALNAKFSEIFETKVKVFPVVSGTASNALALSVLTPCYGKIFCHEMSHINTDECGAPEFFSAGAKLIPIASNNGKISPEALGSVIRGHGNVHSAQPATLSIAQSTEVGTVYQLDEIAALSSLAHEQGLTVHMDGARFANGLVALDASPAQMTWQAGIDVLSFGGTKNGCLAAEAVIFFKLEMVKAFPFLHKRAGQLLSKMRFISAQLEAYVSDDVWLNNARHANAMAAKLSQGLAAIDGIKLAYPTQSNEIFAELDDQIIDGLIAEGYDIALGELDGTAPPRFVTAWDSTINDVDQLLSEISRIIE
ncbi:MAG: threonine aldolase [Granulosicoccus sp.]|jgi:threonine aldolase